MSGPAGLRFTCACCGKEVVGAPDIAFRWPAYYEALPEAERAARARIDSDLCAIDEEDYFVRAICPLPIVGSGERFAWGVWVSLSGENFQRYRESFDADDQSHLGPMFGWFSNRLPDYPDTLRLGVTVLPQSGRQRPEVWVREADAEHPLYREQRHGIDLRRLGEIYARQLCGGAGRE